MKIFGLRIIKDKTYRNVLSRLACTEKFYEQEKRSTAFSLKRITALEIERVRLNAQLDRYRAARDTKGRFKKRKSDF